VFIKGIAQWHNGQSKSDLRYIRKSNAAGNFLKINATSFKGTDTTGDNVVPCIA